MAERERVKFPGSDEPIPPIREERLVKKAEPEAADDESDEDETKPPAYKQEVIGPRIGDGLQASAAVAEVQDQLTTEDVVPLLFPREVRLQDKGIMHVWAAGVHLVPVSLAGKDKKSMHFYLKAHGVRRTGPVTAQPAKDAPDGG